MDSFDRALLEQLQRDSTTTNSELAERVGLSASQVSRRRLKLEQSGLIVRYRATLNAKKLGVSTDVFVRVTLTRHDADSADAFARFLRTLPQVRGAWALSGEADYFIHAKVASLEAFSVLVNKHLLPHSLVQQLRSDVALQTIIEDAPLSF